jgi:hypothetical protein
MRNHNVLKLKGIPIIPGCPVIHVGGVGRAFGQVTPSRFGRPLERDTRR